MRTRVLKHLFRISERTALLSKAPLVFWIFRCWLLVLLLTGLVELPAQAGNIEIWVEPHPMYNNGYADDYWHETIEDAFAYLRSTHDMCGSELIDPPCYSYGLSPQPHPIITMTLNGIPYWHISDLKICQKGSCSLFDMAGGTIQTNLWCPESPIFTGLQLVNYLDIVNVSGTGTGNFLYKCVGTIHETEPCNDCDGRGNPIHPSTGQKLQVESDYASSNGGLQFSRTYRSTNGYFTSPATPSFTDNTLPGITGGCLPGSFTDNLGKVHNYCFPYVSNGTQTYRLFTPEGRYINFSGPADAVVAKADVNIKVSQRSNANGDNEWVIQREDDSVEIYSTQGLLQRKTSLGGSPDIVYSYSDANTPATQAPLADLLIRMTDEGGRHLDFTWDASTRMQTMTNPEGGLYQYGYDAYSNLTSVTYPDHSQRLYHYSEAAYINNGQACPNGAGLPNALTGITDENGVRYAFFKYDCDGRAISTQHVDGIDRYSFSYTGNVDTAVTTTETDPLGTVRTRRYAQLLSVVQPVSVTQPAPDGKGTVTSSISYDANGNIISRNDFNGITTTYSYDLTRNLETSRTEAAGTAETRTISTDWHPQFRLPLTITEPGLKTSYGYDAKGNITQKTLTDLVTKTTRQWNTSYTYSSTGQILTKVEDGPRTDVKDLTRYDYYPENATCADIPIGCRGQLKQVTNPLGHTTSISRYNASGAPLTIIDPNGLETQLTYDARQRITSLDSGGEKTVYTYDPAGQLTHITFANGAKLEYHYDNAHRLVQINDQLGNTLQYTLDNMGNRITEELSDANGQLTRTQSRAYDALSHLQKLNLSQ